MPNAIGNLNANEKGRDMKKENHSKDMHIYREWIYQSCVHCLSKKKKKTSCAPCPSKILRHFYSLCRVTNCSPNLKEMDYKPNKPNTINL